MRREKLWLFETFSSLFTWKKFLRTRKNFSFPEGRSTELVNLGEFISRSKKQKGFVTAMQ